jgi:hypothetical protein
MTALSQDENMMLKNPSFDTFTPVIHLIYAPPDLALPTDADLLENMALCDDDFTPEAIEINQTFNSPERFLAEVRFGEHLIQVAGLPNPLPQGIVDRTVQVSPWQPQIRASMRQHRSHLSLVYAGTHPDPVEKMIALYRVAFAFENENLLGVVNEHAWTAHPPADFLSPDRIASYRDQIPFILWVGYVKFYLDPSQYWLATKGHHIFDVPDLAGLVTDPADEEKTINRFIDIFYYVYENDVDVVTGDTLELASSGEKLKLEEVYEHPEWLLGPSGTLVVAPLKE